MWDPRGLTWGLCHVGATSGSSSCLVFGELGAGNGCHPRRFALAGWGALSVTPAAPSCTGWGALGEGGTGAVRGWGRGLLPAPCFLGSRGKEGSPPWLPSDGFPLASHQELRKLKELMSATEKIRREKWMDEKTKKIKEITVKGTRPQHAQLCPFLTSPSVPSQLLQLPHQLPGSRGRLCWPQICCFYPWPC